MPGPIVTYRNRLRSGILATAMLSAIFAFAQIACLTHSHCDESGCLEASEEHGGPEDLSGPRCEADARCDGERRDHDLHDTSRHHHAHPRLKYVAPDPEIQPAEIVPVDLPVAETTALLPCAGTRPPHAGGHGFDFAGRAPPLS